MITTTQAAERLGVTTRRVVALCHAGKLRGEKIGRDWLVDESSVEAYAATERKAGRPKS